MVVPVPARCSERSGSSARPRTGRRCLPLARAVASELPLLRTGRATGLQSVSMRGFGASQGSCDPVKVTRPELRIESGILRT